MTTENTVGDADDGTDTTPTVSRRKMVALTGTTSTAFLAGCMGLFNDDADDSNNNDEKGNDENDNNPPEMKQEPPFDYESEDLLLSSDDEWVLNDRGSTEPENLPSEVVDGSEIVLEKESDYSLVQIVFHHAWICEDESSAQTLLEDYIEEIENNENGFVEQTNPTEGLFEHTDQAFAFVLDDDTSRDGWEFHNDHRHNGNIYFRVGNIVTGIVDHRFTTDIPHEDDDHEFYGATEHVTEHGLNLLEQWTSNHEGLDAYLS